MKIPALNKLNSLQIFQIFRFGAPFVVSVILVKLMDQKTVGIYESLVLIGSSFTYFWVSGIINTFIPYYHAEKEDNRPVLVFNVYLLLVLLSVLCFIALYALEPLLFSPGTSSIPQRQWLYLIFLAYNLFNAPSFLMEYLLMVKNRAAAIVGYGFVSFVLQILALTVPIALGYGLLYGVAVLAVFAAAKFLLLSGYVLRVGHPRFSLAVLKPFGAKVIPVMLTLLVGGSMPYIDSYIVLHFFDKSRFAVYQYGAREMPLVLLMANALSNVFSGDIAQAHLENNIHEGLGKLKASSLRLMHSLFPLTLVLVLSGKYLFTHVYSAGFADAAPIFNAFMLLTISRLIFPQTVMAALLKNKEQLFFSAIEWCLNLAADFVFLYWFGLIGIAYATVFAYFSERALQLVFVARLGYRPADYIPMRTWALYAVLTLVAVAGMNFIWLG